MMKLHLLLVDRFVLTRPVEFFILALTSFNFLDAILSRSELVDSDGKLFKFCLILFQLLLMAELLFQTAN